VVPEALVPLLPLPASFGAGDDPLDEDGFVLAPLGDAGRDVSPRCAPPEGVLALPEYCSAPPPVSRLRSVLDPLVALGARS
jgi:hypothetical protein